MTKLNHNEHETKNTSCSEQRFIFQLTSPGNAQHSRDYY